MRAASRCRATTSPFAHNLWHIAKGGSASSVRTHPGKETAMLTRRAFALAIGAALSLSSGAFAASTPAAAPAHAAATPEWIQRSNADAQPLLKVLGDFA